jgi:hypothetical protein
MGRRQSRPTSLSHSGELNPFSETPSNYPFTGMDGLKPRDIRPRSQNRALRVPETRRISDFPFAERFLTSMDDVPDADRVVVSGRSTSLLCQLAEQSDSLLAG